MKLNEIYNVDCLEGMKEIPDNSIDMILCDLPYGITDCEWDSVIPLEPLWDQYKRVIKPYGNIVLFSIQPFTTQLIHSNLKDYRYSWYWKKNNVTGFANSKKQPLRHIEEIHVFTVRKNNAGKFLKVREYLQNERKKTGLTLNEINKLLNVSMASHYFTNESQFSLPTEKAYLKLQSTGFFSMPYAELKHMYEEETQTTAPGIIYYPQGLKALNKPIINRCNCKNGKVYCRNSLNKKYTQQYTNYPRQLLEFDNKAINAEKRLHPTQKPVSLLEYLIKTYTLEGETVLDNCMGSGSTAIACLNTGRNFIGYELNKHYYEIAIDRINQHKNEICSK